MSDTGIVKIHGKEYQTVAKRIHDFRAEHPDWAIYTNVISTDDRRVVVHAQIMDEKERLLSSGLAEEERDSSNINKTSALENAETSAVGRALAFLGRGGTEIASADEVANAINQQQVKDEWKAMAIHMQAVQENQESLTAIRYHLANGEFELALEAWRELSEDEQRNLWRATTKGGWFTTTEREQIRAASNGEEA